MKRSLGMLSLQFVWLALLCGSGVALAQPAADRWEEAIQAFEQQDALQPPPQGAMLFVGSSSIRLWDLSQSFPDLVTVNRGFGGSQLADSARYADRLILKHAPRMVVVYAGDNDIAQGKSPEQVADDFRALVAKIQERLPQTKILYIGIKPSLKRWALIEQVRKANGLIRELTQSDPRLVFVDVEAAMLGDDGLPRKELFVADGLHLSPAGYQRWAALLRPHLTDAHSAKD